MSKIRKIINYHFKNGLSSREIKRALKVSRDVVSQYIRDFKSTGLTYKDIEMMSDEVLLEILQKQKGLSSEPKYQKLVELFPYFVKEVKKTGVTLHLLWEEYIEKNPDGYRYSQFCHHYRVWRKAEESLTMHIEHKAGDKTFVDFTGKKLHIVHPITGEITEVETFVAILGASEFTFVEATMSQKKEDWIRVNENSLHYFGGVSRAIVPDCLKSGVTDANKYEPEINPDYADFAEHYGTVILPARPYKPKDKSLAENAVKIIYTRIFAPLRNRTFFSLEELNEAIREKLEEHNNMKMQRLKISRRQLFDEIEKNALLPLPAEKYEFKYFQYNTKVQFNYHVPLKEDNHYYSVPFRKVGKQVNIIYTDTFVEIFHNNKRIASHKRDRSSQKYTTNSEHMPSHHKVYADWTPTRFLNWAGSIGEHVKTIIQEILNMKKHPEQAFKVCMGILQLSKKYGRSRLNNACQRAIHFTLYSYKGIKNILENGLDKLKEDNQLFLYLPEHENIRGANYFSDGGDGNDKCGNA